MLAVSAIGAGAAMAGQFLAIPESDVGVTQDATQTPSGDVLVAQPGSPSGGHAAAVAAVSTLPQATVRSSAPSGTATAAVFTQDTHQANARDIAALARSVEMERGTPNSMPASQAPSSGPGGTSSALSAVGLGGGGPLGSAPDAVMRATAMNAALSKIGVPYVWGAAGPSAFDCSGLMLWAFKKVGISLPHSSAAQSQIGTPVAKGDLRPGDLVFFYSPVSHEAMYIGDGKVVHASEAGQPVKISLLSRMPFQNARRLSA